MAPTATLVNSLLNTLDEEDYKTAITFIEYLSEKRKQYRAAQIKGVFDEFQNIIGEDKGWENEEAMLKDMARYRKERLGL